MSTPETVDTREKILSPRRPVLAGMLDPRGAAVVCVISCSVLRRRGQDVCWNMVTVRAATAVVARTVPADRRAAAPQAPLIIAIEAATFVRRASESGAEPAACAAASWPSALAT